MLKSQKNPDKNTMPERIGAVSTMIPFDNSKSGSYIMKYYKNTPIKDLPNEIWGNIQGYEGLYQVSNYGRVKKFSQAKQKRKGRCYLPKIIYLILNKDGYFRAVCHKDCTQKFFLVSRLVAKAFIPNPENKPQVNHTNGIKTDNSVENLEWVTHKENEIHAVLNGLKAHGERVHTSKLTEKQVLEIRAKHIPRKYTARMIAKEYNMSLNAIKLILCGKNWKHLL